MKSTNYHKNNVDTKDSESSLETRLVLAVGLTLLPSIIIIFSLLLFGSYSGLLIITISLITLLSSIIGLFYVNKNIKNYLSTLANFVEGIRNNDYSFRINLANKNGPTLEVSRELNLLAQSLQQKQLHSVESSISLDKFIEQIEIPVLVINESQAIHNSNHFAAKLFNQQRHEIIGLSVEQLNIAGFLSLSSGTIVEHHFPTQGGRWEIKSKMIISGGIKYRLLVISDISRALRREERNTWSRMVRVIGHELNNSLTSISSLAETLLLQLNKQPQNGQLTNVNKGLKIIVERGNSLQRFMTAYARIAKLPEPKLEQLLIHDLLNKITALHPTNVIMETCENFDFNGDQDQLQAALINLIKNGLEAGSANDKVTVRAIRKYQGIAIQVIDNGHGIANQANLFVPFYTTKEQGSGIGLVLSREIAEAHRGTLNLYPLSESGGCVAELWLPVTA